MDCIVSVKKLTCHGFRYDDHIYHTNAISSSAMVSLKSCLGFDLARLMVDKKKSSTKTSYNPFEGKNFTLKK